MVVACHCKFSKILVRGQRSKWDRRSPFVVCHTVRSATHIVVLLGGNRHERLHAQAISLPHPPSDIIADMKRRNFLAAAAAAPTVLSSSTEKRSRTYAEVEKILAKGDVKGKLTRDDLATPALMLDLDAFESNVAKMAQHCKDHKRALRPHGKTHK